MFDDRTRIRLAETIAWCSKFANAEDPYHSTRHESFKPREFVSSIPPDDWSGGEWHEWADIGSVAEELANAVDVVCEARRDQLRSRGIQPKPTATDLSGGRLMCTDFNHMGDDFPSAMSEFFLDFQDSPGWDTWFAWFGDGELCGHVVCWIPPVLLDLCQRGMESSSAGELRWLEVHEDRFRLVDARGANWKDVKPTIPR